MATISENLQIIKDSTDAIKQAIIDKGGEISGDISTWADAISELSGGGSSEEYVFTGTVSKSGGNFNINGTLNKIPDLVGNKRLAVTILNEVLQVVVGFTIISPSADINTVYNISLNNVEDISTPAPENIPMFILTQLGPTLTMTTVKFIQQT